MDRNRYSMFELRILKDRRGLVAIIVGLAIFVLCGALAQ